MGGLDFECWDRRARQASRPAPAVRLIGPGKAYPVATAFSVGADTVIAGRVTAITADLAL